MKRLAIKYRIPKYVAMCREAQPNTLPCYGDDEYRITPEDLVRLRLEGVSWLLTMEKPIVINSTPRPSLNDIIEAAHATEDERKEVAADAREVNKRVREWVHAQGDAAMERALAGGYNVLAGLLERCANEFGSYMKAAVFIEDKANGHSYPWEYYDTRLPLAEDFKLLDDIHDAVNRLILPPGVSVHVGKISEVGYRGSKPYGRAVPVIFSADIDGCPEFTALAYSSLDVKEATYE